MMTLRNHQSSNVNTNHLQLRKDQAPITHDDDFSGLRGHDITGNVLLNNGHGVDRDPDGDTLSVRAGTFTTAQGGTIVIASDGSFTYTHAAGFAGIDSAAYTLFDGRGLSATGTATFAVNNNPAVAQNDDFAGLRGHDMTGNALSDNGHGADSDTDGGTLSVQDGTFITAQGGTIVIAADGSFSYTHAAGFSGIDTVSYTLFDGQGGSSTGTVTFTVNNNPAIAQDDNIHVGYNQTVTGNVLANNGYGADSDIDGGTLTVSAADFITTHGGHVVLAEDGSFTYTPANGYSGDDSFTYTLFDNQGGTDSATVMLGVDQAPLTGNGWIDIISLNNPLNDTGTRDHRIPEDDFIYGGAGNDILIGTAIWDLIYGQGGNDTIFGNGDGDVIDGGIGDDILYGGDGAGGILLNDDDSISGGSGNDTIHGEYGDDILMGDAGNDMLYGGEGEDIIIGGAGIDQIWGGNGMDYIAGGIGVDTINGDAGNDQISGDAGNDVIDGGAGDDRIMGGADNDTIHGGADNDYVMGDTGTDALYGDDGDDALTGGAGADTLDGGNGDDKIYGHTVSSTTASTLVAADPALYYDISSNSFYKFVAGPVDYATAAAAAAAATLSGVAGHLAVITSAAESAFLQTIITGGVNAWIAGSDAGTEGAWTWSGGVENGFQFSQAATGVNGFFTYWAGGQPANASGNEDYAYMSGSTGLWGANTAGTTYGYIIEWDGISFGDDNLIDTLTGGAGADIMEGGGGADSLTAGDGNDQVWGGAGDDTITGDNNDDMISGDDGNDTITGGAGIDYLFGGNNNDIFNLANGDFGIGETITGGAGTDTVTLTNATTVDFTTGTLATLDVLGGSTGNDVVTLSATQWVMFLTNDLAGGTDTETVVASGAVDISGSGTPTVSNLENGYLTGSGGNDTLTIAGVQLNAILAGSGTINFGAGASDTLNLTSTSTDLNTWGATDALVSSLEIVSASAAAAGVTITLSGQTEGFTITGSANADTLTGGSGNDTITGGAGADAISTGDGTNTVNLANNDFGSGESIAGGAGTDTVVLTNATTVDFTTGTLTALETLTGSASGDTVTIGMLHYAGMLSSIDMAGGTDRLNVSVTGAIDITAITAATVSNMENGYLLGSTGADDLTITGAQLDAILVGTGTIDFAGGSDTLNLTATSSDLNTLGATDASIAGMETVSFATAAAGITLTLSGQTEGFTVTGSASADTITGGSGGDTISAGNGNNTVTGGAGADTITAGTGTDTINLANNDFASGESIDGGTGTDSIVLTNATTVDFTTGTLAGIETITGSGNGDTVTVYMSQAVTSGMLSTINLGGGTDSLYLRVSGAVNISAATLATLSNIENGSIAGSTGDDTLILTSAQFNSIIFGTGIVDMGAGTADAINLNGTTNDLNTLGSTDDTYITGVEVISFAGAAGGVTLDLSLQTEGFTVTGGTSADTLTLGDGDDVITAGAGVDTIVTGEGENTVNLANGDFGSGESITGGGGTDTIILTNATTIDLTTGTITDLDAISGSSGIDIVTLDISQVIGIFEDINLAGGSDTLTMKVSGAVDVTADAAAVITNLETAVVSGSAGVDTLTITGTQIDDILVGSGSNTINMGASSDVLNLTSTSSALNTIGATDASIQALETISLSAAAASVTLTLSGQTEGFTITGSANDDTLTLGSGGDTVTAGAGTDTVDAGGGNDTINLANGDWASGESITGGSGTDSIVLTNATTIDFTSGTLATVETLTGSGSGDTVTMAVTTFGGIFTTINLGGGTDTLNTTTSGTTDISGASATTVSNTENGNLTGSSGDDSLALTGGQLDGMLGSTTGTVAMGAGDDTVVLTSTSARFNTTGATDGSITGLETITVSGSPSITISISGQTEDFTINGGGGVDTITGGRGDTTIYGNAGNDVIVSSSQDTLAAQAAAIVAANSGVVYNSTTDSFYKYVTSTVGWTAANAAAVGTVINGIAGHLVQVNNAAENTAIDTLAAGNEVWLGISDVAVADQWLLMGGIMDGIQFWQGLGAGSSVNFMYENWSAGEPNNSGSPSYARMLADGTWADQAEATTERYIIEWEGSQLLFATTTTSIIGGAGADTITGGAGKDTFLFDTASSGSVDTINSYNVAHHDVLDVSQLLSGYVPGTSDVDDFVRLTVSGANLLLQVDANGTTGGASFTTIATLVGLGASGLNVTEMVANRNLVLSVPTITFYFDWGTGNYTYNSNTLSSTTFTNTDIGRAPMDGTNEFSITRTSNTATLDYLNASAPGTLIVTGSSDNDRINISGIISALTGTVNLGAGNDRLTVTSAGNFTINGGIGSDIVTAGAGADTITGGTGVDTLDGGSGNDTFNLGSGDWSTGDSITGGSNTDTLLLTAAQTTDFSTGTLQTLETFTGSGGNDTVTLTLAQIGQFSTFNMNGGTDVLHVTASGTVDISSLAFSSTSNTETGDFTGSASNDAVTIAGGQLDAIMNGAGIIDFGAGSNDTLSLTSTSSDLNTLGGTNASIVNLEFISASTASAGVTISLTGQTEGFTITGSSFADTITGGSGGDTIDGGASTGNDTLNGNGGTDTVTYGSAGSAVTVSLALQGAAQNTVGAGSDTLSNFENLTGSSFNDTLTGDGGANVINTGAGNDTAYGGGNNDTIYGNSGADTLYGEAGNDSLYSGTADTLASQITTILGANAGVVYNSTTGSFYKYVNTRVTWNTADAAATATTINGVSGHLVQINNSSENSAVDTYGGGSSVWIGVNDVTTEGTYQMKGGLMDGLIVRSGGVAQNSLYQNWAGGNPSASSGTDDYIRQRSGGRWYDNVSTDTHRYLIEWEGKRLLTPTETTTLSGGAGNDTLYGSAGQDIFYFDVNSWGAANADTISNASANNAYDKLDLDKLDIHELLSGLGYTAGVSDNDLFARFTVSGANLLLQVDRDGSAGAYAFTTVATLNGAGASGLNVEEMVALNLLVMT